MNCPCCDKPMLVYELRQIEVDHCVTCHGIWLDSGELELLLGKSRAGITLATKKCRSREKKRRCPICRRYMCKQRYSADGKMVTVDVCGTMHGMWFDDGELAMIAELVRADVIAALLVDIFAYTLKTSKKPEKPSEVAPHTSETAGE